MQSGSQMLIFMDKSPLCGLVYLFEYVLKTEIIEHFGYARNGTSGSGTQGLRQLYNRYFYHITIMKWFQICTTTIRKCPFEEIFVEATFSIEIPIVT